MFVIWHSRYGGLGLFAARDIPKGRRIEGAEYDGKLIGYRTAMQTKGIKRQYIRTLNINFFYVDGTHACEPTIDPEEAAQKPGKGSLINVSKTHHNVILRHSDRHGWEYFDAEELGGESGYSRRRQRSIRVCVKRLTSIEVIYPVASRDIKKGEELLLSTYGPGYDWGDVNPDLADSIHEGPPVLFFVDSLPPPGPLFLQILARCALTKPRPLEPAPESSQSPQGILVDVINE
jgi:hypothetical protein